VSELDAMVASTLFQGLSAADCLPFVETASARRLSKGDDLFRLGQPADSLFIVRSGVVHLTMPLTIRGGKHEVVVQDAGPGDTIAWSALIAPRRFTMSARVDDDTELLAFAADRLRAAFDANPRAGLQIMTNVATVIAQRLQVMHTMCARGLQRAVNESAE
jgi:CRP-like cAMP-binding protein